MYIREIIRICKEKAKVREDLLKQYYNQQREIRHQEEVITKLKSFNRENLSSVRKAVRKC